MATGEIRTRPAPAARRSLPPLESGDQLTRDEFERRYAAMPEVKKAELIEGTVYMPSPVRVSRHASPHAELIAWMGVYRGRTPDVKVANNATVRLDGENELQPDAALFVEPSHGGQVRISPDDYIEGGAELLGEVAASTASIDLNRKLRVYERHQVREYIVWRVYDEEIDWFVLRGGSYDRLPLGSDGLYRSEVFPGLWLDAAAMLRFDLARVLQVLEQGIATPEHADFVTRLGKTASGPSS